MSCKICGREGCASWMHSKEAQEKYDERQTMSDDVDALRREVQDLREENKRLQETLDSIPSVGHSDHPRCKQI